MQAFSLLAVHFHALPIRFSSTMGTAWKVTAKRENACIDGGKLKDGAGASFYVRDNGAGFEMAYGDKLFGAVQRLSSGAACTATGRRLATLSRLCNGHSRR